MKQLNRMARMAALALCGGLLAYGTGSVAPVGSSIFDDAQAASSYTVITDTHIKVRLPESWKKILTIADCQGHTSGAYQARFAAGASKLADAAFEIYGVDYETNESVVISKTTASLKKFDGNDITWTLKNKSGNKANINVRNIYYTAWCKAHNKDDGYPGMMQSTNKINKLIRTYSNGKTSYSKVIKLSKSQAISKGKKEIKAYARKHIIPGIELR